MPVDDSYTKSLLHFEGADASTSFIDENGRTWTAGAGEAAQIDTAEYMFGGASGYFSGASDYISTPDHADFTVGSDDWTVEAWAKLSASGTTQRYIYYHGSAAQIGSDSQIWLRLNSDSQPSVVVGVVGGTALVVSHTSTVAASDGWFHIAGIKYGTNLYVSYNGVLSAGSAITAAIVDSAQAVYIGGNAVAGARLPWTGWIDEFRFSKGIARYTANFTPSGPFGLPSGESTYFADGFSVY